MWGRNRQIAARRISCGPHKRASSRMGDERPRAPALTIHAHCGRYASALRRCVRSTHDATVDSLNLPDGSVCEPLLQDFRSCGRDFLAAHLEAVESKRCTSAVKAARDCKNERLARPECDQLELAAINCLSKTVAQRMSTSRINALYASGQAE